VTPNSLDVVEHCDETTHHPVSRTNMSVRSSPSTAYNWIHVSNFVIPRTACRRLARTGTQCSPPPAAPSIELCISTFVHHLICRYIYATSSHPIERTSPTVVLFCAFFSCHAAVVEAQRIA
jgi:hypothetical protein